MHPRFSKLILLFLLCWFSRAQALDQKLVMVYQGKDIDITTGRNIVDSDFELQAMEFEKEMEQKKSIMHRFVNFWC